MTVVQKGEYSSENLLKEVRVSEPRDYRNYMRMDSAVFDDLLKMVAPVICKNNTVTLECISVSTLTLLSGHQ